MTHTKREQAHRVVETLSRWLQGSPGRSVDLKETSDGWRATMVETRTCSGSSALDALSQIAVVAEVESEERT